MDILNKVRILFNHAGVQRYGSNVAWLLGEKILRMIIGLFVGTWIARYLGAEQFGLFSYAQSLVMLFASIASLGLDGIIIRNLVIDESEKDILLGTAFVLKFLGGILVVILVTIASNFVYSDEIVLVISAATIFQSFNVIDFYFQSKVLSRFVVFANIITLFISSVIKIFLVLNKAPLIAFAWMVVFDSFILSFGLIFYYIRSKLSIRNWTFDRIKAGNLLIESWPLILAGLASMINMRMDQTMLGNMTNNSVVGNYAAAIRVAELWLVLPMVIGPSIYPAIIAAKKINEALYRRRIMQTIQYMGLFAIPFALITSLYSNEIIELLYGDRYSDAGIYLKLSIWTGVPYLIFFILNQVALIEQLTKLSFYITCFIVVSNIVLNAMLIPEYGGVGSAIASLVVAYGAQFLSIVLLCRKTKVFSRSSP